MKAVLVGYGEVGKGMYEVLKDKHEVLVHDFALGRKTPWGYYDVMLVAIPYSPDFVNIVRRYRNESFSCHVAVIFSTVPVGTSLLLGAIHSPIEGRHDNMAESIRRFPRFLGGGNSEDRQMAGMFFSDAGLRVMYAPTSRFTEFAKLQSLAAYGIGIEWARYCKQMVDGLGCHYEWMDIYNRAYNDLVEANGQPEFKRPIYSPPAGSIGGHCVLKGIGLLNNPDESDCPHPFLQTVLNFNGEGK